MIHSEQHTQEEAIAEDKNAFEDGDLVAVKIREDWPTAQPDLITRYQCHREGGAWARRPTESATGNRKRETDI